MAPEIGWGLVEMPAGWWLGTGWVPAQDRRSYGEGRGECVGVCVGGVRGCVGAWGE